MEARVSEQRPSRPLQKKKSGKANADKEDDYEGSNLCSRGM